MAQPRRRERGIALLLALLVLVILGVVVVQMTASSLSTKTIAENYLADLQNTYGVRAGYHQAVLYLRTDYLQAPDVDSLGERWAQPIEFDLGRAHVQVVIRDTERSISLSQLVTDQGDANPVVVAQLRRLVRTLGHPPDVTDRIVDYVDADSKGAYEARAKNDRLFNLDELLRIEGIAPEVVYGGTVNGEEKRGLTGFVTAWPWTLPQGSVAGAVNVNTAPIEVLLSLADEMNQQVAEAIVAARSTLGSDGRPQALASVEDVRKAPGVSATVFDAISSQLVVKSQTFEIRVRSRVGNLEKAWLYVVRRTGSNAGGVTLLVSQ
ncbi:MAG TPA: type II secretion system protein GspK, partial [Planctomycetota bacterium]|nr:type II secretion system protein GspK [Planctomycetota bacterium]